MTSLYEYRHPIINKSLASSADENAGRRFPTLESWYQVVNDYEFQARCPIILKNSHRNKHFTFACHLKDCPFKVLLSYCGGQRSIEEEDEDRSNGLVPLDKKDGGEKLKNGNGTGAGAGGSATNPGGEDAEDDDVSAAIAAAVAAVQDSRHTKDEYEENSGVRGPFVVTKIEPYHNHPLESNLTLQEFVLTKVPRILQHDLNFDQILESLCNEDDNTVSKFRVSQYVEESGLLDILKERYGLTDAEIDKKLLSQISRRVTTYKARFVLKKKKNGEYGTDANNFQYRQPRVRREPEILDADAQEAQAAAQAAIGEAVALKRHIDEEEETPRKRQMVKLDEVMPLEDTQDDKLPRDVAEQLRLLSSHFKDVEAQTAEEKKEDISDENIQPELRGQ
ncbi:hypothetical protein ZYGR_0Z01160 [Zygosaccharomyces rouxii]|uniref:ZYRO0G02926p n=2 Tax=Zygosaccharomyces rouxii TaxID=4956 RepID=C5DZB1_ZYGRC|nr:uncharacterized protein ZYRO0G02926g [Zygosaccharomyces rouxii]KAH9202193.1 hypothetical protein LQ764DRAFT_3124 [Zygosaccharomyces rouxii]GAV50693.1 hypothetical protein ZYGR_0Z01160 [Zygosaccharomyces rouxii]CAR29195.1 ZYRO0G02926p [Zygosaccharomyces rouxii]